MSDIEKTIERYLDGEMSISERQDFELELRSNVQLQNDLITYQEMKAMLEDKDWHISQNNSSEKAKRYKQFLESNEGKKIKTNIANADEAYFKQEMPSKKPSSNSRLWYLLIAAILAALAFYFFAQDKATPQPEQLYAQYNQWDELPSLTLRNQANTLADAEQYFQAKDYQLAISILKSYQIQNTQTYNPQVATYIGVAQLESGRTAEAISTFKNILDSKTLDAPKANWYLALAYLNQGEIGKSRGYLEALVSTKVGFKTSEAKALLEALTN